MGAIRGQLADGITANSRTCFREGPEPSPVFESEGWTCPPKLAAAMCCIRKRVACRPKLSIDWEPTFARSASVGNLRLYSRAKVGLVHRSSQLRSVASEGGAGTRTRTEDLLITNPKGRRP